MRAGMALIARPPADQQLGSGLQWVTRFGTMVESLGFAGIWVTDSMGRGKHTLAHGGKRAILTNVHTDLGGGSSSHAGTISLQCTPAEARERLQRLGAIGFDDVMLICQDRSERHLDSVRALFP